MIQGSPLAGAPGFHLKASHPAHHQYESTSLHMSGWTPQETHAEMEIWVQGIKGDAFGD